MGVAKIQISNEAFEMGMDARMFGQIFFNLPEGTKLVDILDTDHCVEFLVHHQSFMDGGCIQALFRRTAYVEHRFLDDPVVKYIDQFAGLDFDYALNKV